MKEKGVEPGAAASALASLAGRDEVEGRSRCGVVDDAPPADPREKSRQVRFLLSRGYPVSVAFKVLKRIGAAASDEDP